ncbi:c-type cytochrome domain-containing protein [Candidatus Laterigemmans baculatus]|uniref:c-type cytochrome domain-containing protein n=1 Tax=Candidatus Laterigemmans baculatus TaxID=2770505 RepID=UPI0013DC590D|nr:c-type cytochrome domain-containing protein [Candidatus Laterigemmans baculatus]
MDKAVCLKAIVLLLVALPARGDELPASPVDEEGRIVSFERDIAPLLEAHCLECHGAENPKADFRVDDPEIFLQYVEPEDIEASTLYLDYLLSEDPDMLMPPPAHGGPLSPADLALVRVWIEEGADWPEGARVQSETTEHVETEHTEEVAVLTSNAPWSERIWAFQGYFHPATVHFPIALLILGGLFVVLGMKWDALGTQVPLVCLLLGAATAVVSCIMGWSFATERGFPSYTAGFDAEVNSHRWSGIAVAVASVVLSVIAVIAVRRESVALNRVWKVGLLLVALAVGLVGHQGGELTYGTGFYPKAFERLFGVTPEEVSESIQENLEPEATAR